MKKNIAIVSLILVLLMIGDFPTFGSETQETEESEEIEETRETKPKYEGLTSEFPPDREFDLTEFQVSTLREIILLFKQALGKNLYEELFLHNGTMEIHSEIIDFKNLKISFEIFPTKDDTFFLYADSISCDPRKHLVIKLKQKKNDRDRMTKVTGNLKYLRTENSTQTCEVFFGLEFEFLSINMKFHHMNTNIHKTSEKLYAPMITEWKEYSCNDVDEKQRRAIRENTLQAMMYWMKKKLLATQLPFQSICDKCEHLQNISNEMNNYNFVHLKPNHTTSAIPWKSSYSEIIIRGLHDFNLRMHQSENTVQYEMEFLHTAVAWEVTSITREKIDFMPRRITMNGSCTEFTVNALSIQLHESKFKYVDKREYIRITSAVKEKIKNLETLIVHGIDRELQNNTQCDATQIFKDVIRLILLTFQEYPYKNIFYNNGRQTVYFSDITNIKKEKSQHSDLKHKKCLFHNSLEVDELNYKKIAANVKLQYHAGNETKIIIALFEMKNLNSTSHNLLSTKELETEIDRNFMIANKTTMILSNQNYPRKQRILIAENIYNSFLDEMKDQIINAAESFRELSDICTDPMKEYQRQLPNYQQTRKKYYVISFLSDWNDTTYPFTSRFVEVIIDGTWNFKSINVGYKYENEYPVFYDLRMENVTGSIKQSGASDASETVKLNFFVKNLNLHFRNKIVWAEVHESEQDCIIPTTLHNSSLIIKTVIIEKIQRSIASFIQLPVFGTSGESEIKQQKLHEQLEMKAKRNESPSQYDISSLFSEQFVSTLQNLRSAMKEHLYRINYHPIKDANDIPDEMKRLNKSSNHFISLNDVKISLAFPITREETRDPLDHSQVQIVYNGTLHLKGIVEIMSNSSIASASIYFWARNRCTIITFKNDSNGEFQLDVIIENMEVRIKNSTQNMHKSVINEENDLKIKLKQISILIIKTKFPEVRTWFSNKVNNFCEIPHIAANETYSDLLNDSQQYVYPMKGISRETYPKPLIYHISLHGLFNFKLLNLQTSEKDTRFHFEARNLTAHIIWNYVSDNFLSVEAEKLDVQIEAIELIGKIDEDSYDLQFFDESTLLLSPNQGNIEEQKSLTENLNKIVMPSIKQSIITAHEEIKINLTQSIGTTDSIQRVSEFRWKSYYDLNANLFEDITGLVINSLRELILIFRQAFGRNFCEELFSQNQTMEIPSGMTSLENLQISFSIFQTGNNMFFIYTDDIECQPGKYLRIKLKQKNSMQAKIMKLTGSLKYPQLENSTQTCQVNFSMEFEFLSIQVMFHHDVTNNNTHETSTDLKVTEWIEHSCNEIDEEQRTVVRKNTLQAMLDRVEKTLFTNPKFPFQSIRERCEQLLNDFHETTRDDYVFFKSGYNAAKFLWKTEQSDILIRGLHYFSLHMHHFEDAVQYKVDFPRTSINWVVKSVIAQNFIREWQHIAMNGTFNDFTNNAFNIKFLESQLENENIIPSAEQINNLETLIARGIDQELRNNGHRDVTEIFCRNIISEMMFSFGNGGFENPFESDEKKATYVFNIKSDVLQNSNSEFIKCSFNNSLEIGAFSHKQVTAQVNLQYQAGNEAMKKISAFVKMRNFNSTPYNFLLDTKELETKIERNLHVSKRTIMILSMHRFEKKDRIAIGEAVFGYFVKEMKDRIISVVELISPISDTCKLYVDKLQRLYSNYQKNHKKYYISFPTDWIDTVDPFTNRYVRIIINGPWNFKSMNTRYSKTALVLWDLQLENITGSIKQIDALDPGTAVQLNFIVKCLSIKIYRKNGTVRAEVLDSKQTFITSIIPNSNSPSIRTNVIIEKFQKSIASFIYSSYNQREVPYWPERMIEDFDNQMAMWNESLPQYNISSLFSEKFVETLENLHGHLKKQGYRINYQHYEDSNEVPNEMKRLSESSKYYISVNGVNISSSTIPVAYEVTCKPPNHTQIAYNITLQLTGMAAITNDSNFVLANISFLASTRSTITTRTFENDSNEELRFDVACEDMEIQLKHPSSSEKIHQYETNEENDLKNKLEKMLIAIIKTKSSEALQSLFYNDDVIIFCELPHVIAAANETYFNLLSDSRRYFYSIKEHFPLDRPIDNWLVFQINLYGLFNFKSIKMQYFEKETKFEFQARNVTACIGWKRNQYPVISKMLEKMDVEIEAIILRGVITTFPRRIVLSRESTLRLSPNQGNIEEEKILTENLNAVVMDSFAKSIEREYYYT